MQFQVSIIFEFTPLGIIFTNAGKSIDLYDDDGLEFDEEPILTADDGKYNVCGRLIGRAFIEVDADDEHEAKNRALEVFAKTPLYEKAFSTDIEEVGYDNGEGERAYCEFAESEDCYAFA